MSRFMLIWLIAFAVPCLADDTWQTIELVRSDDLSVHLRIRESASLADEKWIALEFRNHTDGPLRIQNMSYRIRSEGFDAKSGKPLYSGSLGQGNGFDLFGKTRELALPVGTTETWEHISDYATALVSQRAADTRIDAQVYFYVQVKDKPLLRARRDGKDFIATNVVWRQWSDDDLPKIQARLRRLLDQPGNHHSVGYVVGALLKVPEVAARFGPKVLVDALPRRMKNAFSGRDPILRHLNEHHHNDDVVIEFVRSQIRAAGKPVPSGVPRGSVTNSSDVQTLLYLLPQVWHDDFLDGLVELYQRDGYIRLAILRHLSRHGYPKSNTDDLSKQLSQVFFESGAVAKLEGELQNSSNIISVLGLTRDRRLIKHLAPLLRDRRELPTGGLPIAPIRICDLANQAIVRILDGKAQPIHQRFGLGENSPRNKFDEAIEQLEERLLSMPEFAAVLKRPMQLEKESRELVERWKAERQTADFFKAKEIVKTQMSLEQVRDVLGPPVKVEKSERGIRHLYLEPDFRASFGEYHWLSIEDGKAGSWTAEAWNERYDPRNAPPIISRSFGEPTDHGQWDDIFVVDDGDVVILRRDAQWAKLILPDGRLQKMGEYPKLGRVKIKHALTHGKRMWLLCESKDVASFAIDLETGTRTPFTVDDAELPASIQSHTVSPSGTALLMISGGAKDKWPRDGNRPIYHWLDLKTGKARQLPSGWDPNYFLPDLSTVVGSFHGNVAVDMRDGEARPYGEKPDVRVNFDWGDTSLPRPLTRDDPRSLIGVTVNGKPHYLKTPFVEPYIPKLQTKGERLALHLRGHADRSQSWCLWTSQLKPQMTPDLIAHQVQQWELVSKDHCAFTCQIKTFSGDLKEAFFCDTTTGKFWNVLDGVADLPAGSSNAQIIAPFGSTQRKAMVLFRVSGWESRTTYTNHWRRWVVARTEGERMVVKMPEAAERDMAQLRLHNSGTLVLANYRHQEEADPPRTRYQLTTRTLQLEE